MRKKKLLKLSAISRTPFSENFLSSEFLFQSESSVDYVIILHASFYHFGLENSRDQSTRNILGLRANYRTFENREAAVDKNKSSSGADPDRYPQFYIKKVKAFEKVITFKK